MDNLTVEPTPIAAAARMTLSVAATLILLTALSILTRPPVEVNAENSAELAIAGRLATPPINLASVP